MISFAESEAAMEAVERLCSVAVAIASLESLVRSETMSDSGLCSWRVAQLATKWSASRLFQRSVGWTLAYPRVLVLIGARLACGATLLVGGSRSDVSRAVIAAVIVIAYWLMARRSPYGHDGADQMVCIVFISTGLAHLLGNSQAKTIALWFIALQVCLSYFTAGVAKLSSPIWRSGEALPGILATEIYGHAWAGALLMRYPLLAKAGCWSTILFECAFSLVLLGLKPLTIALLIAGTVFHLGTAAFMRLNTFLWAFIGTYPAVLYCSGAR